MLRQIEVIATSARASTQQMTRSGGPIVSATPISSTDPFGSKVGGEPQAQEVKFLVENEEQLLSAIRSYGRFQLDGINLALQDLYMRNEDYITPANDHETMYKCLQQAENLKTNSVITLQMEHTGVQDDPKQQEAIIVDFSKDKSLIEKNVSHLNESIINITLAEAKELIRKAKSKRETKIPPLNLEELDDERESSVAEVMSSLGKLSSIPGTTKSSQTTEEKKPKSKSQRFKPKITINNCNGTINLRNISNLTINCATEEALRAEIPYAHAAHLAADENDDDGGEEEEEEQNSTPKVPSATTVTSISNQYSSSTGNDTPTTTSNTASSSNFSSNASSRSQSKKHKCNSKKASTLDKNAHKSYEMANADEVEFQNDVEHDDDGVNEVHCEFYNRLLNEIKNSLKEKTKRSLIDNTHYLVTASDAVAADSTTCDSNSNTHSIMHSSDASAAQPGKRLVLKNFENLKIILESHGGAGDSNCSDESFHPVQIEQWLAEIISETDLEPMQNTDILEHSRIHNETC